jgi:hypothetical protein
MLGKVLNINPASDFKGKGKSFNKKGDFKKVLNGYTNPQHDSSDISAASNFLKKTNWQILKLTQTSESVFLNFIVEDFKVKIEIDLRNLASLNNLKYTISKNQAESTETSNFAIIILSQVTEIPSIQYTPYFEFDSVRILFNRIEKLDVKSKISKYDSALINSLLEGQLNNLENEFNYLNLAVLTFVKLITFQGILLESKQKLYDSSISIEKIFPIPNSSALVS